MEHVESILLPIVLGGLDLSVGTTVAWTFLGSLLVITGLALSIRRVGIRPTGAGQVVAEQIVEFVQKQVLGPTGLDPVKWTPFIMTLFLFILANNLTGVIPGAKAATSNINETGALALLVFVIGYYQMFRHKGPRGFVHSLIPEGVKGPVLVILMPIELASQMLRPFSLAVRLFANMSGGHLLLLTIIGFTVVFANAIVTVLSVGGAVFIFLFEIFVAFIQAYVFAFLSALLISQCLGDH
jgi:F-type H+-transporting ATPase subunit a